MTYGRDFNGRSKSWRPRAAKTVAATYVPCVRGCGIWIKPNPTNECGPCFQARMIAQQIARQTPPAHVQQALIEPRIFVIDGVEFVSCWNGRDSLNPESETPGNLGSSLLDSSPLRS